MFTGIVTDIGQITAMKPGGQAGDRRFVIRTRHDMKPVAMGASIACSGCCLTVIEKGGDWFAVEASGETLDKTHLGDWKEGTRLNLEMSLKLGDELGGHLVSGHVDGIAELIAREDLTDMARLTFRAPAPLARFIATKGSVALDGVSLTVNEVDRETFAVLIIPHTLRVTMLGALRVGHPVNLEVDQMARYAARLMEGR